MLDKRETVGRFAKMQLGSVPLSSICLFISAFVVIGCKGAVKKSDEISGGLTTGGGSPAPGASTAPGAKPPVAYKISVKESGNDIRTQGSGVNECVEIKATVLDGDKPAPEVPVEFKAVALGTQKDFGEASPVSADTNEAGEAISKFCSGKDPGVVTVKATAGATSANTGEIKSTSVPAYRFSWKNSKSKAFAQRTRELLSDPEKLADHLSTSPEDVDKADPITFFLRGSGNDCGHIEFELTRDGAPASGQTIKFQTQEDFPLGVKLAKREDAGAKDTNASTGKSFAYNNATSNVDGIFQVPFCSGPTPGTVVLNAVYTETDGRVHEVKSPIIVMSGGLSNYGFMSLSFDPKNSRVIPADTFTNTQQTLPFIAQLGTIGSGTIIKTNPLSVLAEVGRVIVEDNGVPDDKGIVKFSYEVLNTRGKRPFMTYSNFPDLSYDPATGYSACEPLRFTATASGGPGPIPYSQLVMNWRSTAVYYMRGSEYASRKVNGSLDPATPPAEDFDSAAAFGFWDVNQNGVFDGSLAGATISAVNSTTGNIDRLTYVPPGRTPSSFNPTTDDWFVDLPTPFVDANENGKYDFGEPLVGDRYIEPNGKYDTDTTIWKSTTQPVYLGASAYSLQHSLISSNISSFVPSQGWIDYHAWLSTLNGTGYGSSIPNSVSGRDDKLFGHGLAVTPTGFAQYTDVLYFHAQDKCGNPIPGGRNISTVYTALSPAAIGPRPVTTHFYVQPYDALRESSKRLLAKATGSADTTLNFDVTEHPASKASYPVELVVRVAPCENRCAGDLLPSVASDPPRFCTAEIGRIDLNIEGDIGIGHLVSIPEANEVGARGSAVTSSNKCGCAAGATLIGSSCACPTGTILSGSSCVVPP
jgi:hypothetical protein